MSNYRIKYKYPWYSVQERMVVGWWIFKKDIWIELYPFYDLKEAEEYYKRMTDKYEK